MTQSRELYKAVIVGGGPAGIGIFIRAARTGYLPRLLDPKKYGTTKDNELSNLLKVEQMGVAVLHDGNSNTFGGGNLGEYIINSNTFACSLLASILDEKSELDPPESIKNTFLEGLRTHVSAKRLEELGAAPGKLTEMGCFLRHVGACLVREISGKACDTSKVLYDTTATKFEAQQNGLICVHTRSTNGSAAATVLYTEHLILATGGTQELPSLDNLAYHSKLFTSDSCLREEGFAKLKRHLLALPPGERKVCIVGGSHSSFSVAWLLLNKFYDSKTKGLLLSTDSSKKQTQFDSEEIQTTSVPHLRASDKLTLTLAPLTVKKHDNSSTSTTVKHKCHASHSASGFIVSQTAAFSPKDITILHRSPIRCYYGSKKEAEIDGVDGSRVDRSGCVNTFTGLREDAKKLFKSVKSGREVRVRLFQVNEKGSQTLIDKAYATAGAIVWGAGYKTNLLPGFDEAGKSLLFEQDDGVIKVDMKARLQLLGQFKGKCPSILGLGLGFSLRSAVDEMGMETRVDGVTVYHRRGASLVLEALFGPEVYGSSSSFEEMVEKNEKKKRDVYSMKTAEKVSIAASRVANIGQALVSLSKGHTSRCGSVVAPHLSTAPAAHVIVRQSPSNKLRQTESPTNPPVKLLLLRRRASVDISSAKFSSLRASVAAAADLKISTG
ncbi:putative FAD/NAD(P)-binding domain, FAD/NAD(P)-binding domain superfamily [Plasmopara halstedii]